MAELRTALAPREWATSAGLLLAGLVPAVVRGSGRADTVDLVLVGVVAAAAAAATRSVRLRPLAALASASVLGVALVGTSSPVLLGAGMAAAIVAVDRWTTPTAATVPVAALVAGGALVLATVASAVGVHPAALAVLLTLVVAAGVAIDERRDPGRPGPPGADGSRAEPPPLPTAPTTVVAALVISAVVAAVVLAVRDLPPLHLDDAAITFRYADRIADGHGFTYNDGDRTNGASAPLYTLVLAALRLAGADLETAATALGVALYGAAVGLVALLGTRLRGVEAGGLAAVALLVIPEFRVLVLSGMESGMAVVIGLATLLALVHGRPTLVGVGLGLAVLTKLDGALLVAAVVASLVLLERSVPVRSLLVAAALAAPWFAFSTAYFGSPVPYSAAQKAAQRVGDPASSHDPWWIYDHLSGSVPFLLWGLAAAAVVAAELRGRSRPTSVLATTLLWGVLHAAAFSLVDLGDAYPWYLTVLYPPLALGLGVAAAALLSALRAVPARPAVRAALAVPAAVVLVVVARTPVLVSVEVARHGHTTTTYEAFEMTRSDAGMWLHEHAAPGDVVRTCFGWVAYRARQTTIDEVCPLNTRQPVGEPTWLVDTTFPGKVPPRPELGPPAAAFISRHPGGGATWVYATAPPDGER